MKPSFEVSPSMTGRLTNKTASLKSAYCVDTDTHSASPATVKPPSSQIFSRGSFSMRSYTFVVTLSYPSQETGIDGTLLGASDGNALGATEGDTDGDVVGVRVGSEVGLVVGTEDGADVGERLGAAVTSTGVGGAIGDPKGDTVDNGVSSGATQRDIARTKTEESAHQQQSRTPVRA